MATWSDWHSHHTPPELAEEFARFTGKRPHIDSFDAPDFSKRLSKQPNPTHKKIFTERNSRKLLHL